MNNTYFENSESGGFSEFNAKEGFTRTLNSLISKRKKWEEHQKIADNMLYHLLEETLSFYRFLKRDEKYEEAFKDICPVRYGKRTKLSQILVESVFGKGKKTYAYTKAIVKAFDELEEDEGMGMYQWLVNNGGVDGVIRGVRGVNKQADDVAKLKAARRYAKHFYKVVEARLDDDADIRNGVHLALAYVEDGVVHTHLLPGYEAKKGTWNAVRVEIGEWMIKHSTAAQRAQWDKEAEREEAQAQTDVVGEMEKMGERIAEKAEAMEADAEPTFA